MNELPATVTVPSSVTAYKVQQSPGVLVALGLHHRGDKLPWELPPSHGLLGTKKPRGLYPELALRYKQDWQLRQEQKTGKSEPQGIIWQRSPCEKALE